MKLMILDGNSIINRAFYGVKLLTSTKGIYTNAIIGFLNIMEKMKREEKPDAFCVAFDLHGPTFRHLRYDNYKANRSGMPEELAVQLPYVKKILKAMNVPIFTAQGWEADDILGTAGRICAEQGWKCVIVTGDRDSLQLITDTTSVKFIASKSGNTETVLYDRDVFYKEFGFEPIRLIDCKALMGDSSDNIPGVPGIGKVGAANLLHAYGSLEGVYKALQEIKDSMRKKLEAGKEMAELSYELATIRTDAPVEFSPADCLLREPNEGELYAIFEDLQCFRQIEQYHLRKHPVCSCTAQPCDDSGADKKELPVLNSFPKLENTESSAAGGQLSFDCTPNEVEYGSDAKEPVAIIIGAGKLTAAAAEGVFTGEEDITFLRDAADKAMILCCDCKALYHLYYDRSLPLPKQVFDLSLAGYLLDAGAASYALDKLSERYLSEQLPDESAQCAAVMLKLYPVMKSALAEQGLEKVYYEIDLPLCPVLAQMERDGIGLDRGELDRFSAMLSEKIAVLEERIYETAGERFNINSTKKLGELLFEKLQLPHGKKTKTGYSTGAEVLEKLRPVHPIIEDILDYRQLTKLQSTYAVGLAEEIDGDGRIRTCFQNTVTATGRLSSTDPNLQNIPVRTDLGSEIRKMFIAAPGKMLVDADYSQIELRVLAAVSGDEAMQQAFISGEDFHSATAAGIFGVPISEVTPAMRRNAKAINFGIVYGISKWSLSKDLGIETWEAEEYMNAYFRRFPKVRTYMDTVVREAREKGYCETVYGRRRYLPELNNSNFNIRSGAERMALNSPIQGAAADIIKIAMIRVAEALKREYPSAKLVLQVHDELIVECDEADAAEVSALVSKEMLSAAVLSVPLTAEACYGKSWYEAKK